MPEIRIRPIALADIAQFQHVTDAVMRERKYLAFTEGFPIDEAALFVARNLRLKNPQVVADHEGRVVGCRRERFERVELSVYGRNAPAVALYRKVGFVHEGTRVRSKKLDGEYDDVHMMGLLL